MRSVRAHGSETALTEIIVAIEDTWQNVMRVGQNPRLTVLTNTIDDGAISNFGKIDVSPVLTNGRRTTRHKQ
jgi:hypothetical protein